MVFIVAHVLCSLLIQTAFDKYLRKDLNIATLFDNLLNAIANIYFHNKINRFSEEKSGNPKALEFGSKWIMEFVIFLENIGMLIVVLIKFADNPLAIGIMIGSFCLHILGNLLKLMYYQFFYIWKDVLWTDLKKFKKSVVEMRESNTSFRRTSA